MITTTREKKTSWTQRRNTYIKTELRKRTHPENNWTQVTVKRKQILIFSCEKVIIFSFLPRYIEDQPIPETPAGEPIQLKSFPFRKGSSSIPDSVSDRRPDGAEEPEVFVTNFFGERKGSKSSVRKSLDTLSSYSKLQQIPERQPLMSASDYPAAESPPPYNSKPRHRSQEFKVTSHTKCRPFNPLSPNCDQHQFSPNNIHTLSKEKVMRENGLIFDQILSTHSLRKYIEISLENLYVDFGA